MNGTYLGARCIVHSEVFDRIMGQLFLLCERRACCLRFCTIDTDTPKLSSLVSYSHTSLHALSLYRFKSPHVPALGVRARPQIQPFLAQTDNKCYGNSPSLGDQRSRRLVAHCSDAIIMARSRQHALTQLLADEGMCFSIAQTSELTRDRVPRGGEM